MRGAEQGAAGICVDYVASRPREGNSVFSAFFPPFCWGTSACRRTVWGIASRSRSRFTGASTAKLLPVRTGYDRQYPMGSSALASVHTRYSSKLLYSGTRLAAADGLIMATPDCPVSMRVVPSRMLVIGGVVQLARSCFCFLDRSVMLVFKFWLFCTIPR